MTDWSAAETASLAARAARGAGLGPAQAALYGRAAARHLADGGAPEVLRSALLAPGTCALITRIACLPPGPVTAPDHPLAPALLASLPGRVEQGVYDPERPPRPRAARRIDVPAALAAFWHELAARTYVPDSAASHKGAGGADL